MSVLQVMQVWFLRFYKYVNYELIICSSKYSAYFFFLSESFKAKRGNDSMKDNGLNTEVAGMLF